MEPEIVSELVDFTNQVLRRADLKLEAEAEPAPEDGVTVQVRGDDVSILLAHNAELLDALEYLGNRIFLTDAGSEERIIFDSGSYRATREKELRLMAQKAAERVRTSKVPFSFDPMSPSERRIIHLALVDDHTVRTESGGGGGDRKVTVYPA